MADSILDANTKHHIDAKLVVSNRLVRNRLAPATTEKLVYIYCNKKAVMAAARDDELKMFTWDNE